MARESLSDGVIVCQIASRQEIIQGIGRCYLVYVYTSQFSHEYLRIPCFTCSAFTHYGEYLSTYQETLVSLIHYYNHPLLLLTQDSAIRIASHITNVYLHQANANHPCSPLYLITLHSLEITILSLALYPHDDIADDFPATKPASLFFLLDLVRAKGEKEMEDGDRYELHWSPADHGCSLCMDEIQKPWESLTLPCSHIFHEFCILRWLEKTHVCPLCGLEMPTEDY